MSDTKDKLADCKYCKGTAFINKHGGVTCEKCRCFMGPDSFKSARDRWNDHMADPEDWLGTGPESPEMRAVRKALCKIRTNMKMGYHPQIVNGMAIAAAIVLDAIQDVKPDFKE